MVDLEKVVKGLECCKIPFTKCYNGGCPYFENDGCKACLKDDALALLKTQEPRVLTLREWICAPEPADGECMCYEIKGKGLQAMLVKAFDGVRHLYGKAFRVWTVKPTDAQRKEVKWDE